MNVMRKSTFYDSQVALFTINSTEEEQKTIPVFQYLPWSSVPQPPWHHRPEGG